MMHHHNCCWPYSAEFADAELADADIAALALVMAWTPHRFEQKPSHQARDRGDCYYGKILTTAQYRHSRPAAGDLMIGIESHHQIAELNSSFSLAKASLVVKHVDRMVGPHDQHPEAGFYDLGNAVLDAVGHSSVEVHKPGCCRDLGQPGVDKSLVDRPICRMRVREMVVDLAAAAEDLDWDPA